VVKRAFAPPDIGFKNKRFQNPEVSNLFLAMPVYLPISHSHCPRARFINQVSCSDELAVHSCPLLCLQRQVAKLASKLFYSWYWLRNYNMARIFKCLRQYTPVGVSRMQGLNEGGKRGTISRVPSHYGGAESLRGPVKSSSNVTSTLFNAIYLLPKYLSFEHGIAKLVSWPGGHLTSLHPWPHVTVEPRHLWKGLPSWQFVRPNSRNSAF